MAVCLGCRRLFLGAGLCVPIFTLFWFPGEPKPGVTTVAKQVLSDGRLGERNWGGRKVFERVVCGPSLERGAPPLRTGAAG